MRKLVRFEDRFWFIDLSPGKWIFEEVTRDGVRHQRNVSWGFFMEVLNGGPCIASPHEDPSPEWFINFFKTNDV